MGVEPPNIGALIKEIKAAREGIEARDQKNIERIDELERSLNEVLIGMRRPGRESYGDDRDMARKSAIEMLEDRRSWTQPKNQG
jgi:hypothetical protein